MLKQKIEEKIKEALPNCDLVVTDFSSEHYGHDASGAHILVEVRDDLFKDKKIFEQHRVIYSILDKEIKSKEIHALRIKTGVKNGKEN